MADSLKRNILSLTAVQIGNYIVPLITLPWLTRVLGLEGFGRLGFATAVIAYFILLTEWGFALGATREVAVAKEDLLKRSQIFWDVLTSRFFLSIFGLLALGALITLVPKLSNDALLLWIVSLSVLASMISPVFYFQGIERMSGMAFVNLMVKFLSVPLIVILVQEPADIYLAALIQSLTLLVAATINLVLLLNASEVVWIRPSLMRMAVALKKTSSLFISNAAISLYTNSSTVILGFVASESAVGAFVAAYSLIRAALGLMGPVSQALFPRISYLLTHERNRAEQVLNRVFLLQSGAGLIVSFSVVILGPVVVPLFLGDAYVQSLPALMGLAALPFLIAASNVLGVQIMVPLGHNSAFGTVLVAAGIINAALAIPFGAIWGAVGAAVSMVVAEAVVTVWMALFVKKYEPNVWSCLLTRKMSYE